MELNSLPVSLFGSSQFKLLRFLPELLDLHTLLSHSLDVAHHHDVMDRGGMNVLKTEGRYTEISPETQNRYFQ